MSDEFIQVAPNSTGAKLQTFRNTVSGNDVDAEAVTLVDQFGVPIPYDNGRLAVDVVGSEGQILLTVNGGVLLVRPTGGFVTAVVLAAPDSIAKTEDSVSADGDVGIPAMAIRKATPANLSDTDGDYEMLQMEGGKLWTRGPLTDAELRATPVPISGSFSLPTGAATEAKQDVEISEIGSLTETAPATDTASSGLNGRLQRIAQRITSFIALLPSSLGQKTKANSFAVTLASDSDTLSVSGPLTDTQLRATAVPVSGTVSTGGLTDAQLRASAVPISAAALPLPAGASTEATLATRAAAATQTDGTQRTKITDGTTNAAVKAASTAAVAADPALVVAISPNNPIAVTVGEIEIKNDTGNPVPISAASLPLPTGAATEATLDARTGSLTETAPATDTASSGHNGRLQRIAQRITSLIALLPASLGQKTMANSLAVTIASDQSAVPVSGSVTTGGLTDTQLRASAVPVSLASVPSHAVTNAGTFAVQATEVDGGNVVLGRRDDGRSTSTDNTVTTIASVLKQISFSIQAAAASLAGTLTVAAHAVTNAGVFAVQATIAAGAAAIGKAEDTASADADVGVPAMAIQKATPADLAGTDGDYAMLQMKNGLLFVDGSKVTQPVSAASLPLPTGAATEATLDARTGSLTETAPATDTASSGINGRLQRIAQRITSLIAALGTPFQAGGSIGNTTFASTQSGTWTVQPGNTANTTAWKVDGSAVTQPVSAASLPLPSGAATAAKQPALGTALAPSTDVITTQRPAVTQVVSTAFEASHVLKASAGQLVQLSIFNSGAAQFILLINSATVPADGAVTLLFPPIPIAAATLLVLDLPAPLVASTGIAVCNSSTGSFTKTIGSANCAFYAQVN